MASPYWDGGLLYIAYIVVEKQWIMETKITMRFEIIEVDCQPLMYLSPKPALNTTKDMYLKHISKGKSAANMQIAYICLAHMN